MLRLIALLFFICTCTNAVVVKFQLQNVPRFYTPLFDKIYFASSVNNWIPNDDNYQFDPLIKSLTIDFKNIKYVEFKITRGSWDTTETWADGTPRANRQLRLSSNPEIINLTIEQWSDTSGVIHTATNQVYVLDSNFSMWNYLPRTRRIWIYLPRSYSIDVNRTYPVLYAHDGQNLFDQATSFSGEWQMDESLDRLSKNLIVVGIDNGGAERINELTPYSNPEYGGGQADEYLAFIVDKLRPFINLHFRTKIDRDNTAILGSSLGGLCSYYAALKYEDIFGLIGVFSPSFWFTDDIFQLTEKFRFQQSPPRIYFLGGQKESQTMISDMQRMIKILKNTTEQYRIDPNRLILSVKADGQHSEWFWGREFPYAIQWLFP